MSVMVSITGIAPVVAPSLGAMLVGPIGWRGIMATLAALFLLMLAGVLLVCRETLPPTARGQLTITGGFAQLFRVPRYLGYAGLYATAFATMMAYISASSFVYQDVMGFSAAGYGLLFGVNAVGLVGAGFVSSGLAGRYGPRRLISTAVPALLASSIVVLAVAVTPAPRWILALPILAAVTSVGFILGNASALALQEVRRVSGSGSAFLGAAQFLLGALVAPLAGLGGEHTAVPLGIIMTATAGCAGVLAWVLGGTRIAEHRKSAEQHSEALHDRATFTVRRSVPSDREAILGLMSAARGDARSDAERSEQGFVQGLMDEPILKRLETGPGIFVAEEAESGRLAGFAMTCQPHAVAHNPPAARAVEAAAERRPDARRFVYGPTAVDPVFRGQGVLTMLLLHLCQELGHSYEEGVAFVDHANGKSLAIHTHYGMTALPPFVLGGHTYTPFVFAPDLFARP
jgi:MFS family permease